jgi:protein SCO1/2
MLPIGADATGAAKPNASRRVLRMFLAAGLLAFSLVASPQAKAWNSTDITGVLPALDFTMTRASDGKIVSAADFKGKIVLLYFGYTSCPDVCPTTLLNITTMLKSLGKKADDVRVLFVTVDPNRDTLSVLKRYTAAFAPQVVGLRGTPDQLAELAKRYRVAYSVQPANAAHPVEVSHSSAVYVFDRKGAIRLLFSGLAAPNTKLAGMSADLGQLVSRSGAISLWQRFLNMI